MTFSEKIKKQFPIYNKFLKINLDKPLSILGATLMPFMQALLGAIIVIYISSSNAYGTAITGLFYWSMFALNGKRIALGGWKATLIFTVFATLGSVVGIYITELLYAAT